MNPSDVFRLFAATRVGDRDAPTALFSLPVPKQKRLFSLKPNVRVRMGAQPIATRLGGQPRRVLVALSADAGTSLPEQLRFGKGRLEEGRMAETGWLLRLKPTLERIPYVAHRFADIESLRRVPAAECTTMEYALELQWGGRILRLQPGATGPGSAECLWQNVMLERLWSNEAADGYRLGGIIYNEDTFLWADLYLVLFANGVGHAALHFFNGRLHIKGYDFRGFPYLKIGGDGVTPLDADLPMDGFRQDLGLVRFNFEDTAITCSRRYPALLRKRGDEAVYSPFARIINPQKPDSPDDYWDPGLARTVRFQFSLSDALPAVARYRIPAWWYTYCGEPWPFGYLPAEGRFASVSAGTAAHVQALMRRGGFDGGSADGGAPNPSSPMGNDGDTGIGLMTQAWLTGDSLLYRDALDYCYYWADMAVDHTDFTVHQWVGGWGWKTCAYSKFRDVWVGYLETGDPWLRDTAEMAAATYWSWFRSNWPRNSIGRDAFEVGGWALLARFGANGCALERARAFHHMIHTVLRERGSIGGQMGGGPHPGWHSSLYMTGVVLMSLLDLYEMEVEQGGVVDRIWSDFEILHRQYRRDDVELFPSNLGNPRARWGWHSQAEWATFALRAYAEMGRAVGFDHPVVREGFAKLKPALGYNQAEWSQTGRLGNRHLHPRAHDALMLAARLREEGFGIEMEPAFGEETLPWPEVQRVATPWGMLEIRARREGNDWRVQFKVGFDVPIRVRWRGEWREWRPGEELTLEDQNPTGV